MGTPILNVLVPGVGYVGVPAIKGEKGDPGKGLTILDYYDTEAALTAAVTSPEIGDVYGVGTAAPYDIYVYSASKGWVNNGKIQGAAGDAGVAPAADYVVDQRVDLDAERQLYRRWNSGVVEYVYQLTYTYTTDNKAGGWINLSRTLEESRATHLLSLIQVETHEVIQDPTEGAGYFYATKAFGYVLPYDKGGNIGFCVINRPLTDIAAGTEVCFFVSVTLLPKTSP